MSNVICRMGCCRCGWDLVVEVEMTRPCSEGVTRKDRGRRARQKRRGKSEVMRKESEVLKREERSDERRERSRMYKVDRDMYMEKQEWKREKEKKNRKDRKNGNSRLIFAIFTSHVLANATLGSSIRLYSSLESFRSDPASKK